MNYYERHLGDYARDTGHLSLLEHGVYTILLDRYYATEEGIPADQAHRLARARTDDERAAVDAVLSEFFTLDGNLWVSRRVEYELAEARERINRARENGKKGGRPPKVAKNTPNKTQTEPRANPEETQPFVVGSEKITQTKALQAPSIHLSNQEQDQKKGRAIALALPDWLPADAWKDWHDYRNSSKGWTAKAKTLSLSTLTKLYEQGQDPRAVIDQAIERGWTKMFPVHDQQARAGPGGGQPIGKQMQGLQALEAMKSGNRMADGRNTDRAAKTVLLVAGSHASG